MKINISSKMAGSLKLSLQASIAAITAATVCQVSAAPGELSKTPLFLTSQVQPNILMVVDDSGSMGWENLLTNGAIAAHGVSNTPENNSGTRYLNFSATSNQERRELCVGYNAMAYNPNAVYTPWVGVDEDGNAFTNRTLTTALDNPYDNDDIDNVSSHFYFVWNDDGDGVYQNGECSTSGGDRVFVNTLSADDQVNYANWYTYYRRREYVSKRALSEIITNSKARIGLSTLHRNSGDGFVAQQVKDVDNLTQPVDSIAQANKNTLLDNLFKIRSGNGTPLRTRLKRAGQYYEHGQGTSLFGGWVTGSPILPVSQGGECQQNYTILMSDGYWNTDSNSDVGVGNTDGDNDTDFDGGIFADTYSNTLADVAMHYYERDLAPTYADKLPGTDVDPQKAQHMVTYTVALGVNGTMTGPGAGGGPAGNETTWPWPQPSADTSTTVDDMVHAAWNGRGEFLSANNTDELIAALGRAFLSIDERQGAASAITFNSTKIDTGTYVFQAKFDSSGWHGDLLAYDISNQQIGSQQWSAAEKLDNRNLLTSDREILTYNGNKGVRFRAPTDYQNVTSSEMSSAQLKDLMYNAPQNFNTTDATKKAANQIYLSRIVNYLRGWGTNEGVSPGEFRRRYGKRLGDIIHSGPAFSGAPKATYPNYIESSSAPYNQYKIDNASREPLVFVGSNDGMLHGFNAETGVEKFAYVPRLVFSDQSSQGLHYLAEQNYGHQPYVDGSPTIGDVYVDNKWRTYLVGAMNAGAKGIFVLDVTEPSKLRESFAADVVKFEFTHNDLGYTFSKPQIGRMNNGKWAAVFGNGYNSDPTGDGAAKLFIVYLDGSGYKVIDTKQGSISGANCDNTSSDCNGLSTPFLIDYTGDAHIDRAYAGDLHGNLWVFDLSDSDANNWKVAYNDSTTPKPLFQACSSVPCQKADRQPITSMPVIGVHPTRRSPATWPNLMVYFGTGQYLATNDNFTSAEQSSYGIWDAGASHYGYTRNDLVEQTISATGDTRFITTNNYVDYLTGSGGKFGWYHRLPVSGERVVIDMFVNQRVLAYATLIPDTSQCSPGGDGWFMTVDRMTGAQLPFPVLDRNNDGVFDEDPSAGAKLGAIGGFGSTADFLVLSKQDGSLEGLKFQSGEYKPSRRTSWSVIH